jgi:hypothetical protein
MIRTSKTLHYSQCPRTVYRNSHKVLYSVLSVSGLCEFCVGETSNLHAEFFRGNCLTSVIQLHGILLSTLDSAAQLLLLLVQCFLRMEHAVPTD